MVPVTSSAGSLCRAADQAGNRGCGLWDDASRSEKQREWDKAEKKAKSEAPSCDGVNKLTEADAEELLAILNDYEGVA